MTSALDSVRQRVSAYFENDASAVLDHGAEADAVAVLDATVQAVFAEGAPTMERHLDVLYVLGWLFWSRFTMAHSWENRNGLLATALFAPVCDAQPTAVPGPVLDIVGPPTPSGEPRIDHWNNQVGRLVTQTEPDDRAALLTGVVVLQAGLAMAPGTEDRALCVRNLCHLLSSLYKARVDAWALSEAVRLARQAIAETPSGTPEHGGALRMLSDMLRLSYSATGDGDVLAEAIDHARAAVPELPEGSPERIDTTHNLGLLLMLRYSASRDTNSWRDGVRVLRDLLAELPPNHPVRARTAHNLVRALTERPAGSADEDADEVLDLCRSVADETEPGDPLRPLVLANLSNLLTDRARATGSVADRDEAVSTARQAVAEGGRRVPGTALRSLSQALSLQYDRSADRAALDESLAALERAADATVDQLERAGLRFDLAALHNNRYVDTRDPADARVAVAAFRVAAESPGASVYQRIGATSNAAKLLAELGEWDEATDLIALAVDLLPALVGRHLSAEDREGGLGEFRFLPVLGGSYAIAAGRPEQALELMEWSRNLLFSEDTAIKDGLDELARRAPDLAAALRRLTTELATTTDAEHRHRVDRERTAVVERIRAVEGFDDFLRPQRIAGLLDACRAGPVVIPFLGRDRADALIVTAEGVRHVALPDLSIDGFRGPGREFLLGMDVIVDPHSTPEDRARGESSVVRGLGWLWDSVTGPVLRALGIDNPVDPLPRIWWCPANFLSYYPLHAAGHPSGPNALDLVVSSYTPTVRTLGRARPWQPRRASKPLVVALPRTPGLPDLPAVEQELAHVVAAFPDCRVLRGPAATRDRITAALPDHDIAHFACHGAHDSRRHYESHLMVHDGPLPASSIIGAEQADLAFLSACGTARHRLDLPDESLSMATSFQLAGFNHVVASLWPIADQTTMRVVADFYATLSQGDDPAHALHTAVRTVRTRYPDQPSLWAPYTHRGT